MSEQFKTKGIIERGAKAWGIIKTNTGSILSKEIAHTLQCQRIGNRPIASNFQPSMPFADGLAKTMREIAKVMRLRPGVKGKISSDTSELTDNDG